MEINEQGVVHPWRWPRPARELATRIVALPLVARVFLVLAVADLVVAEIAHGVEIPSVASALTLLLPVAIAWRTPDLAGVDRRVLLGVIVAASVEAATVADRAISPLLPTSPPASDALTALDLLSVVRGLVLTIGAAAAWAWLARGLANLGPASRGWRRVAGGVLVAVAVGTGVAFVAIDVRVAGSTDFGGAGMLSPAQVLLDVLWVTPWLVTAWLAWVTVTRSGNPPASATRAAGLAGALWAVEAVPIVLVSLVFLATRPDDGAVAAETVALWAFSLAPLVTSGLFVVAFATGLADRPQVEEQRSAA